MSAGITYRVRASDSLMTTNGTHAFGPWTAPSNGVYWYHDPTSTNRTRRLYRVDVVTP